ncbi:hypothetical protein F3Y22_tig00112609pilonHSYRG00078 [Hibiscus syriacus]|uniref:DUF668 domain-containing protein n=1 Tax=Hibiscus syriacus TaxID=106335 RepID=A0A6A2WV94_HIBSY|nr:hypothetical protein F3Y22_tig00112609pilonHSYRG00078 [Hibiscus syriacus]
MEELSITENSLRKYCCDSIKEQKLIDLLQKLLWQKQEVKCLKENSLWNKSFDMVASMLVRSVFTILQRVKLVFGLGLRHGYFSSSLPRSLSASATVYPTVNPNTYNFVSGPLKERMIKSPKLVGIEAIDNLYSMLPSSIRSSLRARLKGVGFTANDPVLAGE